MPIRTNHNGGVLVLGMAVFAVIMSFGLSAEPVSAAPASSTKKTVAKTTTTKGVRTKTAYQTRRSGKKKAVVKKAAVQKAYAAPAISDAPATSDSSGVVARAKSLIGSRYRWGGESQATGFDCSGLVKYALGAKADYLPRTSAGMFGAVAKTSELQPGDLVFFGRGRVRHAALYVGNGQVVHASTPRSGVRMDSVHSLAKALGYMGAGRI